MFNYFKSNKKFLIVLCIFIPLSVFVDVSLAKILEKITDYGTLRDIEGLKFMFFVSLLYLPLSAFSDYYYRISMINVLSSASNKLRNDIYNVIFSRDISHNKSESSLYISTLINDIGDLEVYYFKNICFFYHELIYFLTSITLLINMNLEITITILIFAILQLLVPIIFEKSINDKQEDIINIRSEYTHALKEHLDNFNIIKLYRKEKFFKKEHDKISGDWKYSIIDMEKTKKLMYEISFLGANGMYLGTMLIGFYLVYLNKLTIGQVVAASQLMAYVSRPLLSINEIIASNQSAKPIKEKLLNILKTDNIEDNKIELSEKIENISFNNISFSYDNKLILDKCSVDFRKGKKYLIIGESGSGKSTIFKILQGQINNYSGDILINNIKLKEIDLNYYYKKVGFCLQSSKLFSRNIKDNIVMSDKNINENLLENIITSMDLAQNENVVDANNQLSIGQKQRVNISRILYHDYEYLCFDEATASIDQANRQVIEDYLLSQKNKTILYITHNYTKELIKQFDEILYLKNGKLQIVNNEDLESNLRT